MKKLNSKLFTLLISSLLVVPFTLTNNMKVVNASTENGVNSVKEAVEALIDSKNYTIEVTSKAGPLTIVNNMYYTENGFYDDYLGDEYGYCKVDEGVFSFDLYQRKFTASNLLKDENGNLITSLWDSPAQLMYSFKSLRKDEFKTATGKEFNASAKRVKLPLMNMFKINQAYYPAVEDVAFKLNGNTLNDLSFTLTVKGGQSYSCKIKNYNNTKIEVLDNYLATNKSYNQTPDALKKVIELFSNYNFTRIIYMDDNTDFNTIAGYEFYNEKYFYTEFSRDAIMAGMGYNIGMIGLDKEYAARTVNGKTYGPYSFNGSYYCYITHKSNDGFVDENGQFNPKFNEDNDIFEIKTSFPINKDSFIPNVYNYPTFLEMFKNSQYLKVSGDENTFYTGKNSCVLDFAKNFQITDSLAEAGFTPTGVFVEYLENGSKDYAGTLGKETVIFKIEIDYYGATSTIDYVYTDFNNTNISYITDKTVDSVINGIIQSVIDKDQNKEEGE